VQVATAASSPIVRTGVDIVAVARVARLASEDARALDEVFTPSELEYCRRRRSSYEHMAARFAAKEAVLKAFGTGIGKRMRWTDVEIAKERSGRPVVRLHGEVADWAQRRGLAAVDVSLAHSAGLAVAQAVSVWEQPRGGGDALPFD
jgi:holo-[acyl-carrier protein] synthase